MTGMIAAVGAGSSHRPSTVLVALIPALPLAGAAILLLTGRRWRAWWVGWLGVVTVAGSFVLALNTFVGFIQNPSSGRGGFVAHLWDWVHSGTFAANVDLRIDPLSLVMILTVTFVGALIHVYSIDYMRGDPRFARFFGYMNLFVFFMLTLVLANNFLLLYLGWEGVGLCSYLLIGFWFERKTAADAAKKAFVTTRIGDSAFLIGIVFIWLKFHSLDFDTVFHAARGLPNGTATVMALLLFAGAVGKSAQLPLHVWLPDAIEGPTPVSALIHAATMVAAGIYMLCRINVLMVPDALQIIMWIGTATALYSALCA